MHDEAIHNRGKLYAAGETHGISIKKIVKKNNQRFCLRKKNKKRNDLAVERNRITGQRGQDASNESKYQEKTSGVTDNKKTLQKAK